MQKLIKSIYFVLFLLVVAELHGQKIENNKQDTSKIALNTQQWKTNGYHYWKMLCFRGGVGLHKSFYAEFGPSFIFDTFDNGPRGGYEYSGI